ncbi:MAG: hypothetical protein E7184_00095 [Erysipelotrichaceae bacterium]|nr:hypothetical protein [Erysipelotrichaceae bacterium]
MATRYKNYLAKLREQSKKGSTHVNKKGEVVQNSDFQRGVAMGRYKAACEQAKRYNNKKKAGTTTKKQTTKPRKKKKE